MTPTSESPRFSLSSTTNAATAATIAATLILTASMSVVQAAGEPPASPTADAADVTTAPSADLSVDLSADTSSDLSAPSTAERPVARPDRPDGPQPRNHAVASSSSPSSLHQTSASGYVIEPASSPLVFEVGTGATTRIAIVDDRIRMLIGDQRAMSVKTDSQTGEVYVIPLVEGPLSVFVTTVTGTTIPLILQSSVSAAPGNLVLRRSAGFAQGTTNGVNGPHDRTGVRNNPRSSSDADMSALKDTRSSLALAPLTAPDVETAAKKVLVAIAKDEPNTTLMKRLACPAATPTLTGTLVKLAGLSPTISSCWSTQSMRATVVTVRNRQALPLTLDPSALSGETVVAVAADRTELPYGTSAHLTILEVEP